MTTLPLYMDQHIPRAVTFGLRQRGIDVLTAYEDDSAALADQLLLDRATSLGRILFSHDEDFLIEAQRRQRLGLRFGGLIYAHQLRVSIGQTIDDLELIARTCSREELAQLVAYIPL